MLELLQPPAALTILGGISDSTNRRLEAEGLMVPPIPVSQRRVAYPRHEIEAIIAARIAGRSDDEIRRLVKELVAARKSAHGAGDAKAS